MTGVQCPTCERAAAVLKVAAGTTVEEVAQQGLLRLRKVATVRKEWLVDHQEETGLWKVSYT